MLRRFLILLLFALALPAQASASQTSSDPEITRADFLELIDSIEESMQTLEVSIDPARFDQLRKQIQMLGDAPLGLVAKAMSSGDGPEPALNAIEFPEPDVAAACAPIEPEDVYAAFLVSAGLADILAAAKWPCLETVAGVNAAFACTNLRFAVAIAEFDFRGGELCMGIQRSAKMKANLDTQQNIADHLNSFVDATVSSRASQTSLDAMQSDITRELQDLSNLASSLAADVSDLGSNLTQTQNSMASLASATINLNSVSQDIRLKTLVTNAEILEADKLAADVQQRLVIIRNHSQQIIASGKALQAAMTQLNNTAKTNVERELDATLGRAMADPNFNIIRYKLPAAMGGELERSREVLVDTMLAFAGIGVDTTKAKKSLADGDKKFNAGKYLSAYGAYSQAYQGLVGNSTAKGKKP